MPSTGKVPVTKGFVKIQPSPLGKEEHDSSGTLRKKAPNLRETRLRFEGGREQHRYENQPGFAVPPLPCVFIFSLLPLVSGEGNFFLCEGYPLLPPLYRVFAISLSECHLCSFHSATIFPFPYKYAPSCPNYKCFCNLTQAQLLSPLLSTAMSL